VRTEYKPGSWNAVCDRTGFTLKARDLAREWNGLLVRRRSFDYRQPLDNIRGIKDNPAPPWSTPETLAYAAAPNLVQDSNGYTEDRWVLTFSWILNEGGGWRIYPDSFSNFSDDLVTNRQHDIVVGDMVHAGDILRFSADLTITGYVGGSIAGKLIFYDRDRDTIISTETAFTVTSNSSGRVSGTVVVPDETDRGSIIYGSFSDRSFSQSSFDPESFSFGTYVVVPTYIQLAFDCTTFEGTTCIVQDVVLEIAA
jgi:hypothetical protein